MDLPETILPHFLNASQIIYTRMNHWTHWEYPNCWKTNPHYHKGISIILTEKDSAICKLVKKNENDWKKRLRKFFKDCQEKNKIRNDINIDFMVFMIENLRRMFRDEQVQDIYPDFSDMTRELMSFFYYGFLKQ